MKMNDYKRIGIKILILCMFVSMIAIPPFERAAAAAENLYVQDFESVTSSTYDSGVINAYNNGGSTTWNEFAFTWAAGSTSGGTDNVRFRVVPNPDPNRTGNVLEYEDQSNKKIIVGVDLGAASSKELVSVEFDFMRDSTSSNFSDMFMLQNSDSVKLLGIGHQSSGGFTFNNDTNQRIPSTPAVANVWRTFKFELNFKTKTLDIYVDGVKVGNYAMAGDASDLRRLMFQTGDSAKGKFYIDNLKVSQDDIVETGPSQATLDVIAAIRALPELSSIQLSDESAILAAQNVYDALSLEEKTNVTNYAVLTAALAKLADLKNPPSLCGIPCAQNFENVTFDSGNINVIDGAGSRFLGGLKLNWTHNSAVTATHKVRFAVVPAPAESNPPRAGNVLQFTDSSSRKITIDADLERATTTDFATVEFDLMRSTAANSFKAFDILDSDEKPIVSVSQKSNTNYWFTSGGNETSIPDSAQTANKWNSFKFELNFIQKTMTIYVNGLKKLEGVKFTDESASNLKKLSIQTGDSDQSTFYLDNLNIYEGEIVPSAPENVNVIPSVGKALVSWNSVAGASGYEVKYGTSSGVYSHTLTVDGNTFEKEIPSLTIGNTYYFVVSSVAKQGNKKPSQEVSSTILSQLSAPEDVWHDLDYGQMTLHWEAVQDATSYIIEYAKAGGTPVTMQTTETKQVLVGLDLLATYSYKIAAILDDNVGLWTTEQNVIIPDAKNYEGEAAYAPISGLRSNGTMIGSKQPIDSGGVYVRPVAAKDNVVHFPINMKDAGQQTVTFRYSYIGSIEGPQVELFVNGASIGLQTFSKTLNEGDWKVFPVHNVQLNAGINVISMVILGTATPFIDKIMVTGEPVAGEYYFLDTGTLGDDVSVQVTPEGSGPFKNIFAKGTEVTLQTATTDSTKEFNVWRGTNGEISKSATTQITITGHQRAVPEFKPFGIPDSEMAPGYASMQGGTFGGYGGETVRVSTAKEFREAIAGSTPRIVEVDGYIDLGEGVWADVGSYKTIVGVNNAMLEHGGIRILRQSQVIIRNITFINQSTTQPPGPVETPPTEYDSINITGSTHIWVDQCSFDDTVKQGEQPNIWDGSIDLNNGTDFVTITNNYFVNHVKTSLVGHNDDNGDVDTGKLHVTYINNWFNGTDQRHPRVRFGTAHVLNNYYSSITQYGISGGVAAKITAEGNYFENTAIPWRYHDTDALPAGLVPINNYMDATSGKNPSYPITGKNFNLVGPIPYSYMPADAKDVRVIARVTAGAGKADKFSYVDDQTKLRAGKPNYIEVVADPSYRITGSVLYDTAIHVKVNGRTVAQDIAATALSDFEHTITLDKTMNAIDVIAVSGERIDVSSFVVAYGAVPLEKYSVSFESNGGSVVKSFEVASSDKVTEPDEPIRSGYHFDGWYENAALTSPFRFNTEMISSATTLYAKWSQIDDGGDDDEDSGGSDNGNGNGNGNGGITDSKTEAGTGNSKELNTDQNNRTPVDPGTNANAELPLLKDTEKHWAGKDINRLVELGAISGYVDGTFRPDSSISRAEFLKIVVLALNLKASGTKTFPDMEQHWAKQYVSIAGMLGIVNGTGENMFKPDESLTRQEMAVILARAGGLQAGSVNPEYKDHDQVADWALGMIGVLAEAGILQGYPDGSFQPKEPATRAQAAAVIIRMLEHLESNIK
jgi:pectate lyase